VKLSIKRPEHIGKIVKLVRKTQGLDQLTTALLTGNGTTFMSEFENGKPTVELGRVLNVLENLGIYVELDLPIDESKLTASQRKHLAEIMSDLG